MLFVLVFTTIPTLGLPFASVPSLFPASAGARSTLPIGAVVVVSLPLLLLCCCWWRCSCRCNSCCCCVVTDVVVGVAAASAVAAAFAVAVAVAVGLVVACRGLSRESRRNGFKAVRIWAIMNHKPRDVIMHMFA